MFGTSVLARLRGTLIVSCQETAESPLHAATILAAFARAVVQAGAGGVRLDGPEVIALARPHLAVPILGIWKQSRGSPIYITPTYEAAEAVAKAGADLVAVQATEGRGSADLPLRGLIERIHSTLAVPVVAEVATAQEGSAALQAGADALSTTMAGYTPTRAPTDGPDLALVEELAHFGVPVIAEGRIRTPEEAARALEAGAWCVVVGRAITMPEHLVRTFLEGITRSESRNAPRV
jgi:N-acylglucosamine-6-phosphate 2-epimerase